MGTASPGVFGCVWELDFSNTFNSSVAAEAKMSIFIVEWAPVLNTGLVRASSFTLEIEGTSDGGRPTMVSGDFLTFISGIEVVDDAADEDDESCASVFTFGGVVECDASVV